MQVVIKRNNIEETRVTEPEFDDNQIPKAPKMDVVVNRKGVKHRAKNTEKFMSDVNIVERVEESNTAMEENEMVNDELNVERVEAVIPEPEDIETQPEDEYDDEPLTETEDKSAYERAKDLVEIVGDTELEESNDDLGLDEY